MPGAMPQRDPGDDPRLRRRPARARSTSTSARPRRSARTCTARSRLGRPCRSSSPSGSAASPSIPPPTATRCRATSRCSPPTSRPIRRCRPCVDAVAAALGGLNRYPDPTNAALRTALSDRYGVPVAPDRDRQRLVRHPARRRRGAARARRRARLRVAELQRLPAPRGRVGRPRDQGRPSTRDHRHDLDAMLARDHRRHAAGDRLQPEQPDLDGAAARGDRRVRARRPAPRRRDPRRGLLRVQPARRTPTSRSSCSTAHPNLVLLRTFSKVYGLCGLRVGFALCGSEDFRTAVDQVRQPFFCNAAAQAAAIEALQAPGRGRAPRRAQPRRAARARGRPARGSGSRPPSRRPTSSGSTCPRGPTSRRRHRARRARRARPLRRGAGPRGRAARDRRDRGREREVRVRGSSRRCFRRARLAADGMGVRQELQGGARASAASAGRPRSTRSVPSAAARASPPSSASRARTSAPAAPPASSASRAAAASGRPWRRRSSASAARAPPASAGRARAQSATAASRSASAAAQRPRARSVAPYSARQKASMYRLSWRSAKSAMRAHQVAARS